MSKSPDLRMGEPCSPQCDLHTNSIGTSVGAYKECRSSGPSTEPVNQNRNFNKIPRWFVCILKFEKC